MRNMIKLFLAVVIFSSLAGGLLAAVKTATQERIELQQLTFVKGPAIKQIMEGASNDPLADRFKLQDGKEERDFFVGVYDGKPQVVAFEAFGKGFQGDIGVIVGVNLQTGELHGVGVTTHSETPGVGSRTQTDPAFQNQFKGLPLKDTYEVKADGGAIDAVSGATLSSRGVCQAVSNAVTIYERLKPEIKKKAEAIQS